MNSFNHFKNLALLLIAVCFSTFLSAQEAEYPPVDENLLAGTKWQYAYTSHVESNNVTHRADDNYLYYLNLRFDNSFEHFLNGRKKIGDWFLNEEKNELHYNFRNVKWWKIAEASKSNLVLEFPLGTMNYRYHFVRVSNDEAPFVKPANELPDVEVEEDRKQEIARKRNEELALRKTRAERQEERLTRKMEKRERKIEKQEARLISEPEPTFIEIAMIGGGFYGGTDPVIKDYTIIRNTGSAIREFETVQKGSKKTALKVTRQELEQLANFIMNKQFFEFDNLYDCANNDCVQRKRKKPIPIPLRISLQYGEKRKVVTVSIYGADGSNPNYVTYPRDIDLIIQGIQKLSGAL